MKKTFTSIFGMLLFSTSIFALTLPTGQEIVATSYEESNGHITQVTVTSPLTLTTKYGDLNVPARRKISFYESGSIRAVYTDSSIHVDIKKADSNTKSSLRLTSSFSFTKPLEFYESGSIKAGVVTPDSPLVVYVGKKITSVEPKSAVTFYESGSIESFHVDDRRSSYLPKGYTSLKKGSLVKFYENGQLMQETYDEESTPKSLGLAVKKNTPVEYAQNENVLSCTLVDGTIFPVGKMQFIIAKDQTMEFYDDKSLKAVTFDCTLKKFSFSGIPFDLVTLAKSNSSVPAYVRFSFYQTGALKAAECIRPYASNIITPFICLVGGEMIAAVKIELAEDGSIENVEKIR